MPAYIVEDHLLPIGPVVRPAVPNAESIADSLTPEHCRELAIDLAQWIIAADGQNDVQLLKAVEAVGIVLVGNESHGIVIVDLVRAVSPGKAGDVAQTAKGENSIDLIRMSKPKVQGMVSAKTGSSQNQEWVGVQAPGEWQHFVFKIAVVFILPLRPMSGMLVARVPAFFVHAADGIDLEPTILEVLAKRVHHSPVFPLKKRALGSGEDDHARAGVAIDFQLHFSAQDGAVPLVMLAMHEGKQTRLPGRSVAGTGGRPTAALMIRILRLLRQTR